MPQSAFRNLVNTQYMQETEQPSLKQKGKFVTVKKLVARAYLTYEEVFNQMAKDLCDEEANIFMAYMVSYKFPTRAEQNAVCEKRERREALKRKKLADKEKVTPEMVVEANKQFIPATGKPVYWNLQNPEQVKPEEVAKNKRLKVVK